MAFSVVFNFPLIFSVCLLCSTAILVRVTLRMLYSKRESARATNLTPTISTIDSIYKVTANRAAILGTPRYPAITTTVRPIVADIYRPALSAPSGRLRQVFTHMFRRLTQAMAIALLALILVQVSLVMSANLVGQNVTSVTQKDWYDPQWTGRVSLVINHHLVEENLTDFPVLVTLSGEQVPVFSQSPTGDDLVFTAADGRTKLAHEIEKYDAQQRTLVAWVKIPALSSSVDTPLYLYYGNKEASSQSQPQAVWTNGYVGVYHLNVDQTHSPSNAGYQRPASTTKIAAGKITEALQFKNPTDVVDLGQISLSGAKQPLTISAWIKPQTTAGTIVGKRDGHTTAWQFFIDPSGLLQFKEDNTGRWSGHQSGGSGATRVALNKWQYVAVTLDETGTPTFFNEGVLERGNQSHGTFVDRQINASIGARWGIYPQAAYQFQGLIDTVRLSNVVRSAGWLRTERANQAYPSEFVYVAKS